MASNLMNDSHIIKIVTRHGRTLENEVINHDKNLNEKVAKQQVRKKIKRLNKFINKVLI